MTRFKVYVIRHVILVTLGIKSEMDDDVIVLCHDLMRKFMDSENFQDGVDKSYFYCSNII